MELNLGGGVAVGTRHRVEHQEKKQPSLNKFAEKNKRAHCKVGGGLQFLV